MNSTPQYWGHIPAYVGEFHAWGESHSYTNEWEGLLRFQRHHAVFAKWSDKSSLYRMDDLGVPHLWKSPYLYIWMQLHELHTQEGREACRTCWYQDPGEPETTSQTSSVIV